MNVSHVFRVPVLNSTKEIGMFLNDVLTYTAIHQTMGSVVQTGNSVIERWGQKTGFPDNSKVLQEWAKYLKNDL
jgi:hypothetical protein